MRLDWCENEYLILVKKVRSQLSEKTPIKVIDLGTEEEVEENFYKFTII